MSHIYFTISYFTYKLLSNFEITILSCNLCVAEILSPRFVSAPRFVETRWTMLRDASNKQMPRTNKTCVEPNAEFSKIQPTKYMEKTKVSSPTRKTLSFARSSEFSILCVFCRTMSNFGFLLSICFFLILCPSRGSSIHCIFCYFEAFRFRLDAKFGSSGFFIGCYVDMKHRKPPYIAINLLNKVTRMNKEGKKDGKIPSCICKMDGGSSILGIILKRQIRPHNIL